MKELKRDDEALTRYTGLPCLRLVSSSRANARLVSGSSGDEADVGRPGWTGGAMRRGIAAESCDAARCGLEKQLGFLTDVSCIVYVRHRR